MRINDRHYFADKAHNFKVKVKPISQTRPEIYIPARIFVRLFSARVSHEQVELATEAQQMALDTWHTRLVDAQRKGDILDRYEIKRSHTGTKVF
jgi:hypothetical protein